MGTFKKENWHGQEAFENIALISTFVIAFCISPLMNLWGDNQYTAILVYLGIGIYFMILAYVNKSIKNKIMLKFAGIRRWRCRYDLGLGRTGNITLLIEDKWVIPLCEAPPSFQEKVAKTEKIMGTVELEVKAIERGELKVSALSVIEEFKNKREQALKELRDKEITDMVEEEYLLDKLLHPHYENETKKKAFINGQRTKDYTDWINSDGKMVKYIQKEIRNQIAFSEKNKKQSQKEKVKMRLQLIGEQVAIGYPLHEIRAADSGEAEGGAVHGFLKTHYEDYEDLIRKHQILDIAQKIAQEIWVPKTQKVIETVHLAKCIKTVVPLYREASFDHEHELPFTRAVVYAQEHLNDAVDWKERVLKTIDFYEDIPVTNGYSNIIIPTRITHDCPMIFIAHSPGKDYFVRNLKFNTEEITLEKIDRLEEEVSDLKIKLAEIKEKANDFKKAARSEQERKVEYKDAYEMAMKVYTKKNIKQYDPRNPVEKVNIGKAVLYIVSIIAIIFIIIMLMNSGAFPNSNLNNSTSILSLTLNLINNWKFLGGV